MNEKGQKSEGIPVDPLQNSRDVLLKLANWRMPYGKYKGRLLIDLPEPYVVWFSQKGYPKGTLGDLLRALYEIKLNGLENLVRPLTKREND